MKICFVQTFVLLGLFWISPPSLSIAQSPVPLQQQAVQLRKVLEENHYQPRTIDNRFSAQVFSEFLYLLDPHGLYFTQADVQGLSAYRYQLDDELHGNSWGLLPALLKLYPQRLATAEKTIETLLSHPFVFTAHETFTEEDSPQYAKNDIEYAQRWQKWLKYQALQQWATSHETVRSPMENSLLTWTEKESEIRQKVGAQEKRTVAQILEHPTGLENYLGYLYFTAITTCFDPHTNYLPQTEQENFEAELSKETFTFGFDLESTPSGEVIVSRLTPGGPASKSNQLHRGDTIVQLKWKDKAAMDLTGANATEIEEFLTASNSNQLELIVRKSTGNTQTVSLVKERMGDEENTVKSFVLQGDRRIGYISLPSFYMEGESTSGLGCAKSVARELEKLKAEKIEGLILDIRYNGGGSLTESSALAGMFVDQGPLFMTHERGGKITIAQDRNRGMQYEGPMVVMVNGQSASASEVLASTLQDYHRAIIVGSPTYGKATGQLMLPLNPKTPASPTSPSASNAYGSSTVTVMKLYRVTGKSAQLQGVQPDIILPDLSQNTDYRENMMEFALPGDSLRKKVSFTPQKPLLIPLLAERSSKRTAVHPSFQLIQELLEKQKVLSQKQTEAIPLNPADFRTHTAGFYQVWTDLERATQQPTSEFSINALRQAQGIALEDLYQTESDEMLRQTLQNDLYLTESYHILTDQISLLSDHSETARK